MPGTPATSPRHGVPRVANTDTFDIARDVNGAIDRFDITAQRVDFGLAAARPAAGIANRFYYATDTNQLTRDTGSAWVNPAPNAHASTHQDGGADPLTVREAMMAGGGLGLTKGSFYAYRNAALSLNTGTVVPFDTDTGVGTDVSNWYDTATGRYTPQVPGIYAFVWRVRAANVLTADTFWQASLARNGSQYAGGDKADQRGTVSVASIGFMIAVANGTTDFFTILLDHGVGAAAGVFTGSIQTYFAGFMIGRS